MTKTDIALELKGITKRFPGVVANDNISFQLKRGEIHALLGENGAGKSTLMSIVFGLYQPDEGEIHVNGNFESIDNPNKAIDLGIGMVHQHFKLVEPFTVTENIILGMEPKSGLKIDIKSASQKVKKLSEQYKLDLDPMATIDHISVGMQQRVEIIKTLYRGADILIFDEPTAVLTPQEVSELLDIMKHLVDEGKSIILITHKLKEIMEIADTCTVIRRGKVVGSVEVAKTNPQQLAEMMVGKAVNFKTEKTVAKPQEVFLEVKNLVVPGGSSKNAVNNLSFYVRSGEIVGIAGVDGNGQTELIEAITGMRNITSGEILLKGRNIANHTPRSISESGISHIPQDRHKHGLVLDFTVSENIILQSYFHPEMNKNGFINTKAMDDKATKLVQDFDIRTSGIDVHARSMSGGNQQKVIIAREIDRNPQVMIAAQPTRGLDVGAIEFVHKQLIQQRDEGKAVLLVSFELEEIMNVADRILVLFGGEIVGETTPETTNDQQIGLMMAGKHEGDDIDG
ncbi:ABC transporter ATP-binding protein [Paenibacillus sp. CMAA1364]